MLDIWKLARFIYTGPKEWQRYGLRDTNVKTQPDKCPQWATQMIECSTKFKEVQFVLMTEQKSHKTNAENVT